MSRMSQPHTSPKTMDLLHGFVKNVQRRLAFVSVSPVDWKFYVQSFSWSVTLFESYLLYVATRIPAKTWPHPCTVYDNTRFTQKPSRQRPSLNISNRRNSKSPRSMAKTRPSSLCSRSCTARSGTQFSFISVSTPGPGKPQEACWRKLATGESTRCVRMAPFRCYPCGLTTFQILQSIVFSFLLYFVSLLPSLPLNVYSTFVIEGRHGFNKTTPALYVTDMLKGWALGIVLGSPFLAGFLSIFKWAGDRFVPWLMGFMCVFSPLDIPLNLHIFQDFIPTHHGRPLPHRYSAIVQQAHPYCGRRASNSC